MNAQPGKPASSAGEASDPTQTPARPALGANDPRDHHPQAVRIGHIADTHIGAELPRRPRLDLARRGEDFIDRYHRVLDALQRQRVDLVIHAGDLFDEAHPSTRAIGAACTPLLTLATEGIPIVLVPGNHERSAIPGSLLLAHENIHIACSPTTFRFTIKGRRVAITALPCIRRGVRAAFAEALRSSGWSDEPADLRILTVHQAFASARCGTHNFRFKPGEHVMDLDAIPPAFDYVAAGHVHRYQVLHSPTPQGPPIVYAGSTDRITFAETDEPKGYVLIEAADDGLRHRFIEHDVRPMAIRALDIAGRADVAIHSEVRQWLKRLPERAVAQLRLAGRVPRERLGSLNLTARARSLRPDVLLSLSVRGVDLDTAPSCAGTAADHRRDGIKPRRSTSPRARPTAGGRDLASAFDHLPGPRRPVVTATVQSLRKLPTGVGVYAIHDRDGQLMYIGKSARPRQRVRVHLANSGQGNYFADWPRDARYVQVRTTDSELEALLIEAELVRQLTPPFNIQMRRWPDYRFVTADDPRDGPYRITATADGTYCFGPFRSARQAQRAIDALHEARLSPHALVEAIEADALTEMNRSGDDEDHTTACLTHLIRVAQAASRRDGLLILPGDDGRRTIALLDDEGVSLMDLHDDDASAVELVHRAGGNGFCTPVTERSPYSVPAGMLDVLLLVHRMVDRQEGRYRFIPADHRHALSPEVIRPLAFENLPPTTRHRTAGPTRGHDAG